MQINLLRHQCTELAVGKYKKKRSSVKPKQSNHKQHGSESYQVQNQHKKQFDAKSTHQNNDRCSKCGDTAHIEGFQCPTKKYQHKACHKLGRFTSLCFQKKQTSSKPRRPKVHQLKAGAVYAKESAISGQSNEDSSSVDLFCCRSKSSTTKLIGRKFPGQSISSPTSLQIETTPHKKSIFES